LRFSEGPSVVYKPRCVAIEAAWSNLLSWLARNGAEPALPAPGTIEREGYGYVEFLELSELAGDEEARDYFRKAGALLCVAWVAGLDDLHRENVIATRRGPALIDTETAFQARFAPEGPPGGGAMARAGALWNGSFLRSGLLTTRRLDAAGRPVEVSGLRGRGGYSVAAKTRRFSSPNTDAMELAFETATAATTLNLPQLGGEPLYPDDFPEAVGKGFSSMYRFLLERRAAVNAPDGPLERFAGTEGRLVVRPSAVYSGLLLELSAPGFLRDGVARSFMIDSLCRIFRFDRDRPALWLLTRQERRALEQLDLPRFSVDPASRSIRAAAGEEITGRIARSGLEAARDRLERMCPEDLATQRALLEDQLSGGFRRGPNARARSGAPAAGFSGRSLLRVAQDIGEEIRALALEQAGGALTWKTPAVEAERGGEPGVAHGLYAGASGIVLFFTALGAASADEKPLGIARAAALPIFAALASSPPPGAGRPELIGACNGLGSLVYALSTAGRLASDPWYFGAAARAALRITPESIDADDELDVESGAAGAILGLLALEAAAPGSGALNCAVHCGEHLLARHREMGDGMWGWPSRGGLCLAGFAHGAAGIALALGRLSRAAGRPDFGRAALAACRYESTLYDTAHGNWPVLSVKRPPQERI
ncbi:MAG: type 2 lanthipeptide synthetase LanM, partial [Thermoanaerobaculia bacterium]